MIDILKKRWSKSGVEPGDTILVHSDVKRTLAEFRRAGYPITPQDILESFVALLGSKGTLLLPLFNFDFASGSHFDMRTTPSHMGALTEAGRLHSESVRTGHPIYSFAVIGHRAKEFEGVDNESAYSEDSPFGILRRMGGKIASLDLDDQKSMTFYHHVEEVKRVSYRYFKTFTSGYTDLNGVSKEKSYKIYVRNLEMGIKTNVNPAGELLWMNGSYKGDRPKVDSGLRVIRSNHMFDFVEKLIDEGKALGTLYSVEK